MAEAETELTMGQERLRSVTESDKELLFAWTNDPVTRRQSFSQEPVKWEEHCAWFEKRIHDPDCHHYLLEADGEPVGVIRLERCDEAITGYDANQPDMTEKNKTVEPKTCYRISYSIAPGKRGLGYGKKLLQLAEYHAALEIPDCGILAGEVKKENIASACCFETLGYVKDQRNLFGQEDAKDSQEFCFTKTIDRSRCIYFRADANESVGNGHVMRCLTIADACRKIGMYPVFLLADEKAQDMILKRGYLAHVFGTDYREPETELPDYAQVACPGAVVVADSYFLTAAYMQRLHDMGYRLVWLDDLGIQEYPVTCLINYNLYAEELDYSKRKNPGITYLLGAAYAPVRPVFRKKEYQVSKKLRQILITTGAGDPYHAGYLFADALLKEDPDWEVTVICGAYHNDVEALEKLAQASEGRLRVMRNLTDLSDIMSASDLAIAAAGSTLYELCAVGVPTLVYEFADNQHPGAEAFAKKVGSVRLGDLRTQAAQATQTACKEVRQLAEPEKRQRISEQMKRLSDGHGAERIAEELELLVRYQTEIKRV